MNLKSDEDTDVNISQILKMKNKIIMNHLLWIFLKIKL